jgi:hypothetical protein
VIEFPNKKIENTKVSTKERIPRKYPIRTEILSDMITDRARKIGAIEQDQSFCGRINQRRRDRHRNEGVT